MLSDNDQMQDPAITRALERHYVTYDQVMDGVKNLLADGRLEYVDEFISVIRDYIPENINRKKAMKAVTQSAGVADDDPLRVQRKKSPELSYYTLLWQDIIWQDKEGRNLEIAKMDIYYRYNVTKFLERRASQYATLVTFDMISSPIQPSGDMACEAFDRIIDEIHHDPILWIRETPLHRALSVGFPVSRKKMNRLAAQASHWSTCPSRFDLKNNCRCAFA